MAASRLASALVSHGERRITMGEPQQVAPRHVARRLSQPENVATSDAGVQLPGDELQPNFCRWQEYQENSGPKNHRASFDF